MAGEAKKEITKYWTARDLGDLECLYARYFTFSFAPHFHEGFAIGVIESGADVFDYRGAKRIAAAGEIMLINPAEVHTGHAADEENGWTFRIMYVDPEFLRRVREEVTGKPLDIPFFSKTVVRDDRETARRILRLHRALEDSASLLERESLFLLAMTRLVALHADSKTSLKKTGSEHAAIARALDYLHADPNRNVTLKELANIAYLSPFHFLRVFREKTGITPHAYQTQLRIERAKRLLRDRFTIAETAHAVGFFDQSHFSKQFKRYVGITPGQFLSES